MHRINRLRTNVKLAHWFTFYGWKSVFFMFVFQLTMHCIPWIGLSPTAFVWLFCPVLPVLYWSVKHDKSMTSTPIRTETAATAYDCQQLCASAADLEGCRSVNFEFSSQTCELFNTSAVMSTPEDATETYFYESCSMQTPHGRLQLVMSTNNWIYYNILPKLHQQLSQNWPCFI